MGEVGGIFVMIHLGRCFGDLPPGRGGVGRGGSELLHHSSYKNMFKLLRP